MGGETFIASGVKVQGDFVSGGSVTIEGALTGNVSAAGDVTVGETAVIDADLTAQNAFISGKVKGNVHVEGTTELAASAVIQGDIETRTLTIAPGARVNGRVVMPDEHAKRGKVAVETEVEA